jgi:hypothetical protein
MDRQINELSRGDNTNSSPNKYKLRSNKKEGNSDILNQPSRAKKLAKDIANNSKEKKTKNP